MEDNGRKIIELELVDLLPAIMKKKVEEWRLGQICSVYKDGKYEISYSFAQEYELENIRVTIEKETLLPSISRIYSSAFLYENEMRELFGVNIEYMRVDYHNKLYQINEETPFLKEEDK